MANIVQLKRSSVSGRVPDAANISVGEPVVNLADKILYTKDVGGNVLVIGAGTTSNIAEGNNLYFTNARAITALTNATLQGNLSATSNIFADTLNANAVLVGSGTGGSLTGANLVSATYIQGNVWNGIYTANVSENTNLYFTNARVYSNVTTLGYATNSNVSLKANIADLTTSNVSEGTNLYFTNARSRAAISVTGSGSYDSSTGIITITGGGGGSGGVTVSNTTPTVSSGSIWFQPQATGGGVLYIAYNGVWQEYAKTTIGFANPGYFDNTYSRVQLQYGIEDLANVNAYSPRIGDVLTFTGSEWTNAPPGGVSLTTDVIGEASNLYFTNARARAAISVSGSGSYDSSTGIITITGGVSSVNGQTGNVVLTIPTNTSNLVNDSNFLSSIAANSIFASNTYVASTFASNTYVNSNFASNTFVTSTFASNTFVTTTFASNSYVNTAFAGNTYTQSNYTSRARAFTMAVLFR